MWLAVCDPSDEAGLWSIAGLRRLGLDPFEVLLPEELIGGTRVTHRIDADGASVRLELADGREIRSEEVRGVVNRLPGLPAGPWQRLPTPDREYVAEELNALLAGWLFSLSCPVLNPPDPMGLGGPMRTVAEWRCLAAVAGLEARDYRAASWEEPGPPDPPRRTVATVVGERVVGAPPELRAGCLALAEAAGAPLLGLAFAVEDDGRWLFEAAVPQPDLRAGGQPALDALAEALGA